MIDRHGTLELMVRGEAERHGCRATVQDQDIDITATEDRGYTVREPGRGTIVLEHDGDRIALEYWLPEDEEELRRTVQSTLRGDDIERARLVDQHRDDPLVVGG